MKRTHAKGQDIRSLGSEVRVETDGQTDRQTTDGCDCITSRANAVGNEKVISHHLTSLHLISTELNWTWSAPQFS